MRTIRNQSFSSVAYKAGVVTLAQLRAAHAESAARGLSLEAVLIPGIRPELVAFVRDAQSRARVSCPRCGGRRHRVSTITDPLVVRRILRHIGARHEPLTLAPARPPPQSVMQFC